MTATPSARPGQPRKVLVVYGSKSGATEGIAEIVGAALREEGIQADVSPASRVEAVTGYDAVVIGGALYANRWHRDARRFTRRYEKELQSCPVWMFSSGPLDDSADQKDIPPVPQAAKAVQALHAREHVTFGGRLDDQAKGFIARSMVRGGHGGDFRNPGRIESWSRSIAAALRW
jgi:menaquinone-dependent protoporphyrinogen oxidase